MTAAQKAEATRKPTPVEFQGHTYHVDLVDATWETLEAEARGAYTVALRSWLGDEEWAKFTELNPRPYIVGPDGEVLNVAKGMYLTVVDAVGNSLASPTS